jgi:hypothetical protein
MPDRIVEENVLLGSAVVTSDAEARSDGPAASTQAVRGGHL